MSDQTKEAHLIGSLIDSLGKPGEDDVFAPSSTSIGGINSGIYNHWANAGYQQYPSPIAHHSQWPMPVIVRPPPMNVYGNLEMANYSRFSQQQMNNAPPNYVNYAPPSINQQQWESFYTPFGPVKAPVMPPEAQIQPSQNDTPPSSASSPKLPPKGVSYRDVALKPPLPGRSSVSGSVVGANTYKSNGDISPPLSHNMQIFGGKNSYDLHFAAHQRKNSAPSACRQSSSDSLSECGGVAGKMLNDSDSESERSAQSSTAAPVGVPSTTANVRKLENLLRKNEDERTSNVNAFKKHATTTTSMPADFQKIVRRKGKSVSSAVQTSGTTSTVAQQTFSSPIQQTTNVGGVANDVLNAAAAAFKKAKLQQTQSDSAGRFGILTPSSNKSNVESTKKPVVTPPTNRRDMFVSFGGQKLNNEQCKFFTNSKSPTHKSAYINNDLTSSTKDFDDSCPDDDDLDDDEICEDIAETPSNVAYGAAKNVKGKNRKTKRTDSDLADRYKRKKKQDNVLVAWITYVFVILAQNVQNAFMWLVNLITDIGTQLADVAVYCGKLCYSKISSSLLRAWYKAGERLRTVLLKIRQKEWTLLFWWRNRKKRLTDEFGLEKNIDLPNTGEEAMKRLLMCRGQDAYSILGLKSGCTDEDVKHYYRRQAVLVHPDKNSSYGADEAFKILAAAFELIGTPEHRRQYDLENMHRTKAMKDLEEMFARLREKMEEVRSTMHCDCGKKHRRFSTERSLSSARYCRKCKDNHAAREGDIWAESHWFGFLWYYYACMEGIIYDITEWAGCQKNNLKHIKPDTHLVQYRLITGRNARKSQSTDGKGLSDADAEEFLNRLLDEKLNSTAGGTSRQQENGQHANTAVPPQSKFRPPTCPGDSRPRKAGRRRKARV